MKRNCNEKIRSLKKKKLIEKKLKNLKEDFMFSELTQLKEKTSFKEKFEIVASFIEFAMEQDHEMTKEVTIAQEQLNKVRKDLDKIYRNYRS